MVRVTLQYLSRKGSQNAPKHGKDVKEHARKLTHLYLNDQYIDSIGDISACQNLKVLFLQNNQLLKIEGLDFASQLTHLYLQRNKLNKINGLEGLVSLQKLYLGNNSISVVEGLETQKCLQELHIEHQSLCPGEEIIFDPRTIAALGHSLQVLNIQGNRITSLEDLVGLEKIRTLLVASNNLSDITKIQAVLSALPSLLELDMRDNPVVQDYKNCNRILASSQNLRVLNEKQISMKTLDFMKKFEEHEQKAKARQPVSAASDLMKSISDIASNLPEALAKDVTSSIFMGSALRHVNESGNEQQSHSASEMAFLVPSEGGPFFHFPAFKSSTCLQYDGHTIPKPFHRQVILGTQHGQRQQLPRKVKTPTRPKYDKITMTGNVAGNNISQDLQAKLQQAVCGDMMHGYVSTMKPGK